MRLLLGLVLLAGCTSTTDRMLPDGTWQVRTEASRTADPEEVEANFKERALILCPQGYNILSMSHIRVGVANKQGILGRFTCKGDKGKLPPE